MANIHNSLYLLNNKISCLLDKGKLNQALRLIHEVVERIITEPLCTSHAFGSKELDNLCQRIGKANLENIRHTFTDRKTRDKSQPVFTYIVTRLQKSGGHSRVIENFIRARPEARHIVLSTELAGKSDANYLLSRLDERVSFVYEFASKASYQKRLTWLQIRLLQIRPDKVYLFNHHQDSVAAGAIQPEMGLDAYFYHHGDHHLCLGVYLSHLKHIDSNPMGYQTCRNILGIKNYYVPLTVDDKGTRSEDWSFLNDNRLTTCTAARFNKIEISYFISYLDMVPQILKKTGGRHIHIGRLSPWALFRIRCGLKRHGVQRDRFIYTPWVPSVWNALHENRVDLYIASFPYGGGLTLIEAMGAGVPLALHNHIYSRLLSGIDLAYPGVFSWRSPDELFDFISTLTPEYLESKSRTARIQYLKFHRMEILENLLHSGNLNKFTPCGLKNTFFPKSDEWAYWIEGQISFGRVIRRGMYRIFRAIRNWLN